MYTYTPSHPTLKGVRSDAFMTRLGRNISPFSPAVGLFLSRYTIQLVDVDGSCPHLRDLVSRLSFPARRTLTQC